jgi:hypothetical protein
VIEMALAEGRVSTTASARSVMEDMRCNPEQVHSPSSQFQIHEPTPCIPYVFTESAAISIDITTGQS